MPEEVPCDAALAALCGRVQSLLVAASRDVVPANHLSALWEAPKSAVVTSEAAASAGDLVCRAPSVLWRRLLAEQRGGARVALVTTSEYGLIRERVYSSPAELAEAILSALSDEARQTIADARARRDGCLVLTTRVHMCRQRAAGLLHCTACGSFFAGARGLREHFNFKHGKCAAAAVRSNPLLGAGGPRPDAAPVHPPARRSYDDARSSADAACRALVPYGRFTADEQQLLRAWRAQAATRR